MKTVALSSKTAKRDERRPAASWEHTLLGLPAEVRILVIECAFDAHDEETQEPLAFDKDFVVGPAHSLLHVCQSLRREATPVYYKLRHVRVKSLTRLGAIVERVPEKCAELTDLHILYLERRDTRPPSLPWSAIALPDVLIEPSLDILTQLPNLRRLHVDIYMIPTTPASSDGCYTGIGEYSSKSSERAVCQALPQLPKLEDLEITGVARYWGFDMAFSRMLKLQDGKWKVTKRREWYEDIEESAAKHPISESSARPEDHRRWAMM